MKYLRLLPILLVAAACVWGEDKSKAPTALRGSYCVNGRIYVNTFGKPEGKPLTTGHQDNKPSWSKTDDRLVFFRLTTRDPSVPIWRTSICVIGADGTGFRKITGGKHTDLNPTWTRDGSNMVVFGRHNAKTGAYFAVMSKHDGRPGDEYAVSDTRRHTFPNSCLIDGRILVAASNPRGYYLMTLLATTRPSTNASSVSWPSGASCIASASHPARKGFASSSRRVSRSSRHISTSCKAGTHQPAIPPEQHWSL